MRRLFALGFLVLGFAPAVASAKPSVSLKLTGAYVRKSAEGVQRLVPLAAEAAKSGELIRWDIVALNSGDQPATAFVPVGRIPAGTAFVPGSASTARARVEYTVDGKTWSAEPTVKVKAADGALVVKRADPAQFTAIRFVTAGALAPRGSVDYTYQVRVK